MRVEPGRSETHNTWSAAHYLALLGVVVLIWESWSLAGWLADGPRQVTVYRDPGSTTWYAARVFEGLAIALAVGMSISVTRELIRVRRMTLDAVFVICGALAYWTDPFLNFLAPIFSYSSNWINLNDWTAHIPLWRNPEGGMMGEPVLGIGLFYTFGILFFVRVAGAAMQWLRQVRPGTSKAQLIVFAIGAMFCMDFALEVPPLLLGLWAYPGQPDCLNVPLFGMTKYPLAEGFAFACALGSMAALRFFRDDRGHSVVERGLDRHSRSVRTLVSILALTGALQGALISLNGTVALVGLYSSPYPENLPSHVLVDRCGKGTEYGPCPGGDDFRMPIKGQGGVTQIGPRR